MEPNGSKGFFADASNTGTKSAENNTLLPKSKSSVNSSSTSDNNHENVAANNPNDNNSHRDYQSRIVDYSESADINRNESQVDTNNRNYINISTKDSNDDNSNDDDYDDISHNDNQHPERGSNDMPPSPCSTITCNSTSASNLTSSTSSGLFQLVGIAAATAATLGYDVGIMAAAIQPLEAQLNLSSVQKEVAMGSLNFVAAAGALIGGSFANKYGRKPTIQLCSWLFVIGTVCMAIAPSYFWLLIGRVVTGLGVGVSFVVAPVYLSEVAPSDQRGELNTVFDVAINGGILLGYVVGFLVQVASFIPDRIKWRVMLGIGLILPMIVLWFLAHLPESPRYLVMKQHTIAAQAVLSQLGDDNAMATVQSIQDELSHSEMSDDQDFSFATSVVPSPRQLLYSCTRNLTSSSMRLAMGLGFWNQATGTEAVLYYSADFLQQAGLQSATQRLLGNIAVGLCKLTPELVAMKLVDTIGRRPLILTSAVCLMFSMLALSASFWYGWSPIIVVVLLCLSMSSYSIGIGPFSFLLATENLSLTERATGVTLCAAVNRSTSGLVALTAVSLYQSLGEAGFFAFYAAMGLFSLLFFYYIPETSGQTLEEIAAANRSPVPTRNGNNNNNNNNNASPSYNNQERQRFVNLEMA